MSDKKYIIFGLDNSGKTSLAKLMSLFSYGELKFSDTSNLLFENPLIPEELRKAAMHWQGVRKNLYFSPEERTLFRENLKQIYNQYSDECLYFALQRSDIYAGLRQKKTAEKFSKEKDYFFIRLRSGFRLATQAKTQEERLALLKQEAAYETWPSFYDVENEQSFFDFLFNSWKLVRFLKEEGFLKQEFSLGRKVLCWLSWPSTIGRIYCGL